MEIKDIQSVIDLMNENDLSYFLLEQEGVTLKLKKGVEGITVAPVTPPPAPATPEPAAPAIVSEKGKEITSPMVGTFYRAPSPDSDPFVKVGDHVDADTTVCIIEAMKVMNEIKADISGIIQRVVAEEGKPIQYGEPLFIISPA